MPAPRGATGPTTEHGKQITSRNAAKHNCTSTCLILPGETQAEFDALLESLIAEYLPETEMQQIRVNEAARATWELRRIQREYDKSQFRLYNAQPNLCDWTPKQHAECDRMARYRTRPERTYNRALQSVECLRTLRLRAEQRAFWENMQLSNRDLSERRLQLAVQRFEQTAVSPRAKKNDAGKHDAPKRAQPANTNQQQRQEVTTNRLPQSGQTSPSARLFRPRTAADFLAFATQLQEQQAQRQEKLNREKMDREAMEQEEMERKEIEHEYSEQENLVRSATAAPTHFRPSA
ncbi:MAG TPA: hypothetical protein VGG97_28715 [Bryobacteraceae bacterium]|jgi:hypothetical protein